MREWKEIIFTGIGIVILAFWLAYCSRARMVVIEGVTCIESGFGAYSAIDCNWEEKGE